MQWTQNAPRYSLGIVAPATPPELLQLLGLLELLLNGSAYGTRTRAPALRGPCPNRLDERAEWKKYRSSRSSGVQVEFREAVFREDCFVGHELAPDRSGVIGRSEAPELPRRFRKDDDP